MAIKSGSYILNLIIINQKHSPQSICGPFINAQFNVLNNKIKLPCRRRNMYVGAERTKADNLNRFRVIPRRLNIRGVILSSLSIVPTHPNS